MLMSSQTNTFSGKLSKVYKHQMLHKIVYPLILMADHNNLKWKYSRFSKDTFWDKDIFKASFSLYN